MGICASCLGKRDKARSPEESPLLTPENHATSYADAQAAKQQQDLNVIVRKTHDRLIDINFVGRPDMENVDEPIEELREQLNAVEGTKVWTWPQLMGLSEAEDAIVSAALERAKKAPGPQLPFNHSELVEEF